MLTTWADVDDNIIWLEVLTLSMFTISPGICIPDNLILEIAIL